MKPQDNESCLVREPSLLVRQLVRLRIQTFFLKCLFSGAVLDPSVYSVLCYSSERGSRTVS